MVSDFSPACAMPRRHQLMHQIKAYVRDFIVLSCDRVVPVRRENGVSALERVQLFEGIIKNTPLPSLLSDVKNIVYD
jgi:hypothetical protein